MKTPSLSHFLIQADTQIRFFDLGRRVTKISLPDFQKFERYEMAYPFPYEQSAWLGILFWNKKDKSQHNIWFLRMPLDETGFIQLSSRDEFVHMLLSRVTEQLERDEKKPALQHLLKDNPYVFKPTQDKLAVFHSKARLILQQEPSQFFEKAMTYLHGNNHKQWEHLGIQGITDIAVRCCHDDAVYKTLLQTLSKIPAPVFNAFTQNLENERINIKLAKIIAERLLKSSDEQVLANGIRGLANCQSRSLKHETILAVLKKYNPKHTLPLIAISAKAWEVLHEDDIRRLYLEQLAANPMGAELFNSLIIDLMFIPGLREKIMAEFRNPQRSELLSKSVGQFFQAMNQ